MKDLINKYIKANRASMDTELPGPDAWDNIKAAIQPAKKRTIPLFWKVAAGLIVLLGIGYLVVRGLPSNESKPVLADNINFDKIDEDSNNPGISDSNLGVIVPLHNIEGSDSSSETQITDPQNIIPTSIPFLSIGDSISATLIGSDAMLFADPSSVVSNISTYQITVADAYGSTDLTTQGSVVYNWAPANGITGDMNATYTNPISGSGSYTYYGTEVFDISGNSTLTGVPANQSGQSGEYENMDMDRPDITYGLGQTNGFFENPGYEQYATIIENKYRSVMEEPLSTFSIDVDRAAYSNIRRFINNGSLPPVNAVRIEEMVNYFHYDFPEPEQGGHPFEISSEIADCPWNPEHQLVQINLQGRKIDKTDLPPNNLVFLVDVSGSMSSVDKLDLLKAGFELLIEELRAEDNVAMVVYAGAAGLVLPVTPGNQKETILKALNNLQAGGSTAGGEGIELAYTIADGLKENGENTRVILATDGDFNVGVSDDDMLVQLIEKKRETGVFLSVLGFGSGNLKNAKMEKLADNGNGNYFYIDNLNEANKVFVHEMGGTLYTIAKDVKLQLEFNPKNVSSYRLIGYENRLLNNEDFDDDTKDAGELGAGHNVTALYEIIPADKSVKETDSLKYQKSTFIDKKQLNKEILTVKFRYKLPEASTSIKFDHILKSGNQAPLSESFLFASAVTEFGLILRDSEYKGNSSLEKVLEKAMASKGDDLFGYRNEFIELVQKTMQIKNGSAGEVRNE